MGDYEVPNEAVGMGQFTFSQDDEVSANPEACGDLVAKVLRNSRTRPGPDEELVIQVLAFKRPAQPQDNPRIRAIGERLRPDA